MDIVRESLDHQTALLKVTVTEADYQEAVDKTLRGYKRKANIPGFRPGMVPMGVINKMYRKGVVAEESYRLASNRCFDYLEEEKVKTVGDMLPSEQQKQLDFETPANYEFVFEIGLAPKINLALSPKDKVNRYEIAIEKKMREGYRSNFIRRFGKLEEVDKVEKEDALNVTLEQEAMEIQDAYVGLINMSDEERKAFLGKKVGDVMEVNVNELYKTASQRASILSVKEEELETIDPKFTLTITKISRFVEPPLNEELFKQAFADGSVTSESEFNHYIDTQIGRDLSRETEQLFSLDMRKFLLQKANLTLPEAFLKRWLLAINEGKFGMEEIEKDFDKFLEMMQWNLIQRHYMEELKLEITPEEANEEAKSLARMQFSYYGMNDVADEMLENYAKTILENKEEGRKVYEKLMERKVIEALTPMISIKETPIKADDFGKLVQAAQQ